MFAPNTVIENLCQRQKVQAAMVLDALFASDIYLWPMMDFLTILHYLSRSGIFMGEAVLRRGLFDLSQLGLLKSDKVLSRQKGRPSWRYRVKPMAEIVEKLGVSLHVNEAADSIPFSAFETAKLYRGAKHYSFLGRLGTSQLSRKKLGARLGVGARSTYNYEIGKSLTVEHRFDRQELGESDILIAPETRPKNNVFLEVEIWREMTNEEMREAYKEFDVSQIPTTACLTKDTKRMPYTKFILERELKRGNRVFKCKQITNEYKVA